MEILFAALLAVGVSYLLLGAVLFVVALILSRRDD